MDEITDLKTENLMLRHVLEHLWANYISNHISDPANAARQIADQMLDDVERIYASPNVTNGEGLHITLQGILHHEEEFWKSVCSRVEQTALRERRR